MGLRFVIGRAGTGKSKFCLEEIVAETKQDVLGKPLILLVPEQATFQTESALGHTAELGGMMRAQVLSFKRLSWRVLSETGGDQKTHIGEMGKRMILRRLLLEHRMDLKVFARSAHRPGMADLLAQAIGEFKVYRLTPQDVRSVPGVSGVLADKLNDLALLYEEFQRALGSEMCDADDQLAVLPKKMLQSEYLHGSRVWIDGFKGFTPQELYVISRLLPLAEETTVTLPLEPAIVVGADGRDAGNFQTEEELFQESYETYLALRRLAFDAGVRVHDPVILTEGWRHGDPWLRHIETSYFRYPTQVFAAEEQGGVTIASAVNRRAETEGIALEIRRLAREEGLRWNEIAVMSRDLGGYQALVAQIFEEYDIPHFLDYKRPVQHHPLVELIVSALDVATSDWAYEPLFRCLKTDFFPLKRAVIDRLENYCLAHGIRSTAWEKDEDWQYRRKWTLRDEKKEDAAAIKSLEDVNASRRLVREIFLPFVRALAKGSDRELLTGRAITEALYSLLERLDVPGQLSRWEEEAKAQGNLSEARLQGQIWEAILALLDEMVATLNEEKLTIEDYATILSSGLESLQVGLIPPGLDQVLVGSLERSRNPEVKILFLMGATEGILPARQDAHGVFDSSERDALLERGFLLAPKGKRQLYEEQFFIYSALTRAKNKLYITYPLTDEEGRGLGVSSVITRLKGLFPGLKEEFWDNRDGLTVVSRPEPLMPKYAGQLSRLSEAGGLSPMWQAVEGWFTERQEYEERLKMLRTGVSAKNEEGRIPRALTKRLYGKRLITSVSRLEQFGKCPFAHYARYGLRLKERSVHELSNPDMGQFFHALLYDYAKIIQEQGLDWGQLSKEESWALLGTLVEKRAPELQNEILLSTARYRYLTGKLKRTVHNAVRVLGKHARQGTFMTIQLEVKFGPGETLPEMEVSLSDGDSLVLTGQIDRIDGAEIDGQVYLRIMDYKSREIRTYLDAIYHGLDLQLLTYLETALQGAGMLLPCSPLMKEGSTPAAPAGFLYFPVVEKEITAHRPLSEEQMESQRLKEIKLRGYFLADQNVLSAMDDSLLSGKSELFGFIMNKDGSLSKANKFLITKEEFQLLGSFLRRYLKQTGERIIQGEVSLSPHRHREKTACQYCAYKPVCRFEPGLPENMYRNLPKLESADVLKRLQETVTPVPLIAEERPFYWLGDNTPGDGNGGEQF